MSKSTPTEWVRQLNILLETSHRLTVLYLTVILLLDAGYFYWRSGVVTTANPDELH